MKAMAERILSEGRVYPGNILKVDSFLNHQIDPLLLEQIGQELYRLFKNENVTKILTVEASGIAIALAAAMQFRVPMVFAKKNQTLNLSPDVYTTPVESFTHGRVYHIMVDRKYLCPGDRVLIVDDFLAQGNAVLGLLDLISQAGATAVGAGIAVEKGFQQGGKLLREKGLRVESMAIVDSMSDDSLVLRPEADA